MKLKIVTLLLVSFGAMGANALLVHDKSETDLGAPETPVTVKDAISPEEVDIWPSPVPAPRPVLNHQDAVGALLYMHKTEGVEVEQIQDLVWGLSEGRYLGFAILKTIDRHGNVFEYDNLGAFPELIFRPSEMNNVKMHFGKKKSKANIESIQYMIRENGHLAPQFILGSTAESGTFSYGDNSFAAVLGALPCCVLQSAVVCFKFLVPCAAPSACTGTDDCFCKLPDTRGPNGELVVGAADPNGTCALLTIPFCGGECGTTGCPPATAGSTCSQITSDPVTCACPSVGPGGGGD